MTAPADEAERWLIENDDSLRAIAGRWGNGNQDALQEARIEVYEQFLLGKWDESRGTLDSFMRSVAINRVKGHVAYGFPETGEERSGMDAMSPGRSLKVEHLEGLAADAEHRSEANEESFQGEFIQPEYEEIEGSQVIAAVLADIEAGMAPKEAALKHGLRPQYRPLPPGLTWHEGDKRWRVGVRRNGQRITKTFRSRREAEQFLQSLPPGRPRGRPKKEAA